MPHIITCVSSCILGIALLGNVSMLIPVGRTTSSGGVPLDAVFTNRDQIITLGTTIELDGKHWQYRLNQWDIQKRAWVRHTALEAHASQQKLPKECARIGYLPRVSEVLACTDNHNLTFFGVEKLDKERTQEFSSGEQVLDFAPNENMNALYVVVATARRGIVLRRYQLNSGKLDQEIEVPTSEINSRSLAVAADGTTAATFANLYRRTKSSGEIIICRFNQHSFCKKVITDTPISQLSVSDDSLLFVSSAFADRRSSSRATCIQSLSLSTLQIDAHAYCRPGFGVHYAIAISNNFVIGYSGYGTYSSFTENTKALVGSLSVWGRTSRKLLAVANLTENSGVHQNSSKIVAEGFGKDKFLFFNVLGGFPDLLLYDLHDVIANN